MVCKVLIVTFLLVVVSPRALLPQDTTSCHCQSAFDNLVSSLKQNYIGYALQKETLEKSFEERIAVYRAHITDTSTFSCVAAMQDFLTFFHDGHLFVSQMPNYNDAENDQFKTSLRTRLYDPAKVIEYLIQNRPTLSAIEGVWTDGTTRYAVIRNDNDKWPYQFVAVCIGSPNAEKVGELKIGVNLVAGKYVGLYYTNGYSPRYVELSPAKDNTLLGIWGGLLWGRIEYTDSTSIAASPLYDPARPTVSRLDDQTVLLTIPTFLMEKNIMDSVLLGNAETLTTCRYLVIDIRGNTGGNGIYFDLMTLYATRPIVSEIGYALSSKDNLAYFTRFAGSASDDPYRPVVEEMGNNMGKIVKGPRFTTAELTPTPSQLQKVAILTDRSNISAAETFILYSKLASEKVVTVGSNTGGVVDYNNINMVRVSCERIGIFFGYPTYTLNDHILKDGYNGRGIAPDVSSDKKLSELVSFASTYLKR